MTSSMVAVTTVARCSCSCSHLRILKQIGDADACLQERLKAQKAEAASNPEYGSTYKPQTSKEDRTAKRKQILSNIGSPTIAWSNCLSSKCSERKYGFGSCILCSDLL